MRRYIRKSDMPDSERTKLDFVFSVYGPGMKEASLAAHAFAVRYAKTHGRRLAGGHVSVARPDDAYWDISLIEDSVKLPDVIGGMGFGEYLGEAFKSRYVRTGFFDDVPLPRSPISLFDGIDLVDGTGSYHMYGGSAFGFLVNTRKLDGRPVPKTWAEVLNPRYRNMVVCGFNIDDINEIILLYLYRFFGMEGIEAFADNLAAPIDTLDMMRTSLRSRNSHAIYLIPHFFAKAAPQEDYLVRVWPDDGALLAPYYFLAHNTADCGVADIIDFFLGDDLARALTGKEMFHIYSRDLDAMCDGRRFAWLGWDWLLDRDIIETMRAIDEVLVPLVLKKHPELEKDMGRALWNG